jgi:hypothetical protein
MSHQQDSHDSDGALWVGSDKCKSISTQDHSHDKHKESLLFVGVEKR